MQQRHRIAAVVVAVMCLVGTQQAGATGPSASTATRLAEAAGEPQASRLTPRVQVGTPWGKDDTVGDARRNEGDLRRIIVANGRQQMVFTFRTVAKPLWDTPATDRVVGMVFDMDWQGTAVAPDRSVIVTREDNVWVAIILNRQGDVVCSRQGGVRQLTNNRFELKAPVVQCLGGAHVLRALGSFVDDADDTAVEDTSVDSAPNSRFYGPFIRLPARGRTAESAGTGGWTVH